MATPQRVVIGMYDGLGTDYVEASRMPVFKEMQSTGFARTVTAVMPSVTNANNASIATSAWPEEHGITGNSYFDEKAGKDVYMESADSLCVPTILERAERQGVKAALLTCKKKTVSLLGRGATMAIAAENPPPEFVTRYGEPPAIYSREINYWLWRVAADLLKTRPELGLLYVHTTDFAMHMWAPEEVESMEHLAELDTLLGEASGADPDAAFLLSADHGMNYKKRCWDLAKACKARGLELRYALSAEKDRYVKHHRTFGGTAWAWLKSPADQDRAIEVIRGLEGIEAVLPRAEAAKKFRTMPARIGELAVLGDRETVFGELAGDREDLEPGYRSHGSMHELEIPLVIHNAQRELLPPDRYGANVDLARGWFQPVESLKPGEVSSRR